MMSLVKFQTRRFHITSKIFLRKISPKTSCNDHKLDYLKNILDSSPSCQTSSPDYLGIENDENVIIINQQKHPLPTNQQPQTSDNREKFYRASFGIIRFDADNKLKYHGQYKNKIDFIFPHSSTEIAKVSKISQTSLYENKIHQNLSKKDYTNVSAANTGDIKEAEPILFDKNDLHSNYIDECYLGTSEMENSVTINKQHSTPEELNYLERDYFETLHHSSNFERQNTSKFDCSTEEIDSGHYGKNESESLNYFEKDYFAILNNSENVRVEQESENYFISKEIDSNLDNKYQAELNYLEKDYFKSINYSKTQIPDTDTSNYIDYERKMKSTFDVNDESNFSENKNLIPTIDKLKSLDYDFHENISESDDKNSVDYHNKLKSSHSAKNNAINESMFNKCNETNCEDQAKNHYKEQNSKFISSVCESKEVQKQMYKVNFENLHSTKMEKKGMSHKNIDPSVKNPKLSAELSNETVKSFSIENHFRFSNPVSEKPDLNSQIPTAHDFVKTLREEQKIPSQVNVSKGKRTNEEKCDSKGFRILKDQVPNLAYYTRDEILNILKQNIVYSDDDLLILNKPYSLVIHESETTKEPCLSTFLDDLAKELDKQSVNPKLFTVHRLDKETTGCLLLARNETMAMYLKGLFAQRKIVKKYWIITSGVPDPPAGLIDMPISEGSINNKKRMVLHPKLPSDSLYKNHSKHGKPAVTTYKVISESGNAALIEVFPKTGLKHQIRVHFGFGLGCPILGDHKYSHLDKLAPQKLPSDMLQKLHVRQSKVRYIPMHIHAKSVGIPEYFDKRDLFVNIPIPNHFKVNMKRLKFRKKDMVY